MLDPPLECNRQPGLSGDIVSEHGYFNTLLLLGNINTVSQNDSDVLTLSSLGSLCHLHPLQAAKCCRNSRLVVDEDDLNRVKN